MAQRHLVAIAFCLLPSAAALAQTAKPLAFEVASIRIVNVPERYTPADIESGRVNIGLKITGDRVNIGGLPLRTLLMQAYGVKHLQIVAESWVDETRFDIIAKMPPGATKDQFPEMLKTLLIERFHLQVRREIQERPAYVLTVGKNGAKLKEMPPDTPETMRAAGLNLDFTSKLEPLIDVFFRLKVDRPIVDLTGLNGIYSGSFNPGAGFAYRMSRRSGSEPSAAPGAADPLSTFLDSVEQLGLKLEPRRMPIEIVIVDSADRVPTEN